MSDFRGNNIFYEMMFEIYSRHPLGGKTICPIKIRRCYDEFDHVNVIHCFRKKLIILDFIIVRLVNEQSSSSSRVGVVLNPQTMDDVPLFLTRELDLKLYTHLNLFF